MSCQGFFFGPENVLSSDQTAPEQSDLGSYDLQLRLANYIYKAAERADGSCGERWTKG